MLDINEIFAPDDFAEFTYIGALNQMGHFAFGGAIVSVFLLLFRPDVAVLVAIFTILAWEFYQLKFVKSLRRDYFADIIYWTLGIMFWAFINVNINQISVLGVSFAPMTYIVVWLIEFRRLSYLKAKK